MNQLSKGTTWCTTDSQGYRCPESPARDSGLVGSTWIMDMYRPIQMGNWIIKGPRHPMGFTPDSLYNFMVSWERRARSLPNFVCRALSLGWSWDIFWVERI